MNKFTVLSMLVALAGCIGGRCDADDAGSAALHFVPTIIVTDQDRVVVERYIGHAVSYANNLTLDKVVKQCAESPETFAWVDFRHLDCLLDAHELTGDVQYLDLFARSFSLFRGIMEKGDDAYLGWYGKPIPPRRIASQPELRIDEVQMNFRAIAIVARWVCLARQDAAYAVAHAEVIAEYVALMDDHLFPKWEARGFFVDLAAGGGIYRGLDYPICHAAAPGKSLSHEKLSILVEGLLRLYRASPKDLYMQRAVQIGTRFKRCLSVADECYAWMSWEPAGSWDAHAEKADAWAGWIAPDPKGEWYASSVAIAVRLYQHGLVFDDADLRRFVATQKNRCWNGDLVQPAYRTVAGVAVGSDKNITGRFLSYDLAPYDQTLETLAFAGPHEVEVAQHSTNAWKGGVALTSYVRNKFLLRPRIAKERQCDLDCGKSFLAKEANRALVEALRFDVVAPGRITPLKPSQLVP